MSVNANFYKPLVESCHLDTMISLAIETHNQKKPEFLEAAIQVLDQFPLTQEQNNRIVAILRNVPSNTPEEAASLMKTQSLQVLDGVAATTSLGNTELPSIYAQQVLEEMDLLLGRPELLGLAVETVHEILMNLGFKDISTFSLVCRKLNYITSQDDLWKKLYNRYLLPRNLSMDCSRGFYNACKNYSAFDLNFRKQGVFSTNVFLGHGGRVNSLTVANGQLFSGSDDHTIRMWDIKTQQCLKVFAGHQGAVDCIAVASENLFSGSIDRTIRMWNTKTGECLKVFEGHKLKVNCIIIEGNKLISSSHDRTIRMWDIGTGVCLRTLGEKSCVTSLVVIDGKLCSTGLGFEIVIWDLETGLRLRNFEEHRMPATRLTSADGKLYSCGPVEYVIKCWDLKEGRCVETIGCEDGASSLLIVDEKLFVAKKPEIKVWDLATEKWLNSTFSKWTTSTGFCLAFADGELFSVEPDNKIRSFDFKAKDDLIFKQIADGFRQGTRDLATVSMERFCLMPKWAKDKIYRALYNILTFDNAYWGCAEHAFHDQHGLTSTPEQKAQAIENYLNLRKEDSKLWV
jgi:WD40 repeat protein